MREIPITGEMLAEIQSQYPMPPGVILMWRVDSGHGHHFKSPQYGNRASNHWMDLPSPHTDSPYSELDVRFLDHKAKWNQYRQRFGTEWHCAAPAHTFRLWFEENPIRAGGRFHDTRVILVAAHERYCFVCAKQIVFAAAHAQVVLEF